MKADLKVGLYMCALLGVCLVEADLQAGLSAQSQGRLFPPQDLGLLESPDRAAWQKPDQIMDALRISDGAAVADIGAGSGYFTVRLAQRVGPKGIVYAQDVQREMLEVIRRRAKLEGLQNVQLRRGQGSDPNLPAGALDAILVVDTYYQVTPAVRVMFLKNLAAALKPNGRLGIVEYKPGRGGPGPDAEERLASSIVETDARTAGLRVLARENLPYQYLVVLGR